MLRRALVVPVLAGLSLAGVAVTLLIATLQPFLDLWAIFLTAIAPLVAFAAWPVLIWGALSRRWIFAGLATALVAAQLLLYLPTWAPWHSPAPTVGVWRMTVFDMNVDYTNNNLTGIAAEIRVYNPDLITMEEITQRSYASLDSTGVLAGYSAHFVELDGGSQGMALWSRIPLRHVSLWYTPGHPEYQATVIPPSGQPFQLLLVHTLAPIGPDGPELWNAELAAINTKIKISAQPLLVIGDFNATENMRQFGRILGDGLTDAGDDSGQGWALTYPHNHLPFPAIIRIDHVLTSPGLTVSHYRLGASRGSDHRPILVTIGRT